jgi:hypothetical protein
LTPPSGGATLTVVRFVTHFATRVGPAVLALLLAGSPVAECFTPPPGAEMPCCASMHHDEACSQAGSAAECCNHARTDESNGVVVAKQQGAPSIIVALLSPAVMAPGLSQLPAFHTIVVDTGPPPRSTPLHVVISVFLI